MSNLLACILACISVRDKHDEGIKKMCSAPGGPSSLHERGRDSCLRAVLCYKRLFTKVCMGCKRFFLKERKNVIFVNNINLPYCFVVFFVVCSRLRLFWSVFGELALFWCSTAPLPCLSFSTRFMGFYVNGFLSIPLYREKTVYIKTHKTDIKRP